MSPETTIEDNVFDAGQPGHDDSSDSEDSIGHSSVSSFRPKMKAREGTSQDGRLGTNEESAKPQGPWVGYRVEYRNRHTNELIADRMYRQGTQPVVDQFNGPIFEVVTAYKVTNFTRASYGSLQLASQALPTYQLRIHSISLIHAIQSVVRYYPSQDLSGEFITIQKPYPILVHHYDELQKFRQNCLSKPQTELCAREKNVGEHLGILLEFLDKEVMADVREEQERNSRGFSTYEWRWVAYRPGITVVEKMTSGEWAASVVHSIIGGVFENPPKEWEVKSWQLNYDGESIQRVWTASSTWYKFDGERSDDQEARFYDPSVDNAFLDDDIARGLIEIGKEFVQMTKRRCYHHKGKGVKFPYNEIDGLAMVDLDAYYTISPESTPKEMGQEDCRNWTTECTCEVCRNMKQKSHLDKHVTPLFSNFGDIYADTKNVPDHEYLLCPSVVDAYIFRTRTWERVRIRNLMEPQFDENLISHLVMSEQRLNTLKALSKSFARVNKHGEEMKDNKWSADFVRGKGNGLIFLLHGKPGVGKTCTAECIAEFTRRPLMILTSSDIGTNPKEVESKLTTNFKRAMSWGAVLLIDEADVFMERRTTSDLTRNSLVAGFLRALEFYDGILFLTTNRVGSFDDAFISRIHVQLYYPDFTDEERQKVWKTFIDKLGRERGDTMRLTIDAKDYVRSTTKHGLKWNGREIRNAFQTAVALAEYDAEKDEEGRILVTDNHLRAVVELSQDFKGYLKDLHRGDEGKRAEHRYERLDSYEGGR